MQKSGGVLVAVVACMILRSIADEMEALTAFKQGLRDPLGALKGWNSSTPSAPCDWVGIGCYQGHVYELSLPNLQLSGSLSDQISGLPQIRKLSLFSNNLSGPLPPSLAMSSFLRLLYLQNNSLSGTLPPGLFNLASLEVLNVSNNFISGNVPSLLPSSLRIIDVSNNYLSGEIPFNFSSDSQLRLAKFSFNNFSGSIPATIGFLGKLEYLSLDDNLLEGTVPSTIAECQSLVQLTARDNSLEGILPSSLGFLPNLVVVDFSKNRLSGEIPLSLLCSNSGNSSLNAVNLGYNEFTGVAEVQNGSCNSALMRFDVRGNRIEGPFPAVLTNLISLQFVDISDNLISGQLPEDLGTLSQLLEFTASNNSLAGEISKTFSNCYSIQILNLANNRFSGAFPTFGKDVTSLRVLDLSGNSFAGAIDEEIFRIESLISLDVSNNRVSGTIPDSIGDATGLEMLNMSSCGFYGRIPSSIENLKNITVLDLSNQNLSGELPPRISLLSNLQVLALQENMLSGDVSLYLSDLVSLLHLNLSFNRFNGGIPSTLRSLRALSLSGNEISNGIPLEIGNWSDLRVVELRSNQLEGIIPEEMSKLSELREMDLGQNRLTGGIPESICKWDLMTSLKLDDNQLSGPIPESLSQLHSLATLNLSRNSFNGSIPASLSSISTLQTMDLSHNNLEGEIPTWLESKFHDSIYFQGNPRLCGKPLSKKCGGERKRVIVLIIISLGGTAIIALCCCGYCYSLMRWRRKLRGVRSTKERKSSGTAARDSSDKDGPKLVIFNSRITYVETLEATKNFDEENVLSRGRYGLVFKASYPDGLVLSIRRLPDGSISETNFRNRAEALGKLRHRNLTVLRGYYAGPPDVRLLAYDYMPNGSLSTLLQEASHQDGHVLSWPMRHLIALGIARGLSFLHSTSTIHARFSPRNVLFDADFEPHLSEFGLDQFFASDDDSFSGRVGYAAPEGEMTAEGDVYSYGIVLLEILTGKNPATFTEDEDIVKWVKRQVQSGHVLDLVGGGVVDESHEWEEFMLGVKVGLLCTAPYPPDRPSMTDVVFMIEGCRVTPHQTSTA